ncbi:MAG: virulence RhuM family protein [Salinivirgaceae bacterium]|nr:virulence RhuM family protein [Salinivirgaceae bacterium]
MTDSSEIVLYQPDDAVKLEVRLEDETVWLNRNQMAALFGRDVKTIGKHIANALAEELAEIPTVANFATVQIEGGREVKRNVEYYNLDMILSVGYRVKSQQGVLFRQWANRVLKDYLLKGYAINQRSVFTKSHDRFLIIDNDVYHIGASIKDLGKRWFAFCKMQVSGSEILGRLN